MPNSTQLELIKLLSEIEEWHFDKSRTTLMEKREARRVSTHIIAEMHYQNTDVDGISGTSEDNYGADYERVVEPLLTILALRAPELVKFLSNQLYKTDAKIFQANPSLIRE